MGQTSRQTRRSLPHFADDTRDPLSDQAKYDCQIYANNDNVTCYPTAGDQVIQHQWAAVVCKFLVRFSSLVYPLPPREQSTSANRSDQLGEHIPFRWGYLAAIVQHRELSQPYWFRGDI